MIFFHLTNHILEVEQRAENRKFWLRNLKAGSSSTVTPCWGLLNTGRETEIEAERLPASSWREENAYRRDVKKSVPQCSSAGPVAKTSLSRILLRAHRGK